MAVQLSPPAAARPGPSAVPSPLARCRALEAEVRRRLGPLVDGAEPLLAEVGRLVAALHPEPGAEGEPPAPAEATKMRARLGAALDELEDLLEALLMARDREPAGAGRAG